MVSSNGSQPENLNDQNGMRPHPMNGDQSGNAQSNSRQSNSSQSNSSQSNGVNLNGNGFHTGNLTDADIDAVDSFVAPVEPEDKPLEMPSYTGGRYAQIIGWGRHIPEKVITNKELEKVVDTSDEWIRSRTGIEQRHVVSDPSETSATLATLAARKALAVADVPASKVDLIICSTSSPEYIFPSTASIVQDALGAVNAGAFDLSAACSGFVYGLSLARGHILAGDAEYVLVLGTETLSRMTDWTDRNTCILFSDGAGAMLVAASDVAGGITAIELGSDGSGGDALIVPAGGSAMPTSLETVSNGNHYIKMDGKAVFRFATRIMALATRRVIERAGLSLDDIDLVVPHQANVRIIQSSIQRQLKIPDEKVFITVQKYGNNSTATIPIAFCEAIEAGRVNPGDNIVFVGFGAGLTWAACTVKWSVPVKQEATGWWKNYRREAEYKAAAARSMWKRAVRWASQVLPDPLETPVREGEEKSKAESKVIQQ